MEISGGIDRYRRNMQQVLVVMSDGGTVEISGGTVIATNAPSSGGLYYAPVLEAVIKAAVMVP